MTCLFQPLTQFVIVVKKHLRGPSAAPHHQEWGHQNLQELLLRPRGQVLLHLLQDQSAGEVRGEVVRH